MLQIINAIVGTIFAGICAFFAVATFFGWKGTDVLTALSKNWAVWALLLLGISLLVVSWVQRGPAPVNNAELSLRIYGDARSPQRMSSTHIWRWYYLATGSVVYLNGQPQNSLTRVLFVTFEPDVKITTLTVNSPDIALPRYEVKEFNQRYAIISFASDLPAGTLEIRVTP